MTLLGVAVASLLIFLGVLIYSIHKRLKYRRKYYSQYKDLKRADAPEGPSLKSTSISNSTNSTNLSGKYSKNSLLFKNGDPRPISQTTNTSDETRAISTSQQDSIISDVQPQRCKLPSSEANSLHTSVYQSNSTSSTKLIMGMSSTAPALPLLPPKANTSTPQRVVLRKSMTSVYKTPASINESLGPIEISKITVDQSPNPNTNTNPTSPASAFSHSTVQPKLSSVSNPNPNTGITGSNGHLDLSGREENSLNSSRMSIGAWFDDTYGTLYKKYMKTDKFAQGRAEHWKEDDSKYEVEIE